MKLSIAIIGPTASGKTDIAIELSKLLPMEIISADSRQVFRFLTIGTAKPDAETLENYPHHFIDTKNPDEYFSAGAFGSEAFEVVENICTKSKIPLIVGGSGLYVRALCDGLFSAEGKQEDNFERLEVEKMLSEQGIAPLYAELERVDPFSAEKYSDLNPRRLIRALEFYRRTGMSLSVAHLEFQAERSFKTLYFGIYHEREELYRRINIRAEAMFENGIIEETEAVLAMGFSSELNSLNTVGYKETIAYLQGEIGKKKAIELVQQNTRRYAKRQMTWFRKENRTKWLQGSAQDIAKIISKTYIANINSD